MCFFFLFFFYFVRNAAIFVTVWIEIVLRDIRNMDKQIYRVGGRRRNKTIKIFARKVRMSCAEKVKRSTEERQIFKVI